MLALVLGVLAIRSAHAQEQNDCGLGRDASNDRTQPSILRANYDATPAPEDDNPDAIAARMDQCAGLIDGTNPPQPAPQLPRDPADFYGVYLRAGERALITAVVETGGPFTLEIFDPTGARFPFSTEVVPLPDLGNPLGYGSRMDEFVPLAMNLCGDFDVIPDTCSIAAPKAGIWAIGVKTKDGTSGNYGLNIVTAERQDDCAVSQISQFNRGDASNVHRAIVDKQSKAVTEATPLGVVYVPGTGTGSIPPRTTEETANAVCHGALGGEDHSDAYSFFVHPGMSIDADLFTTDGFYVLWLLDPEGNVLAGPAANFAPNAPFLSAPVAGLGFGPVTKSGLYALVIQESAFFFCGTCQSEPESGIRGTTPSTYDFVVQLNQADCKSEPQVDAGNTSGTAIPLPLGAIAWPPPPSPPILNRCVGTLDGANQKDDQDWYKFTTGPGVTLQVRLEVPSGSDFDLFLYSDPPTSPVAESVRGAGQVEEITYPIPVTSERQKQWFLKVRGTTGGGGYALYATVAGTDCDIGFGDTGASRPAAFSIGAVCTASFTSLADEDSFKMAIDTPGTILTVLVPVNVKATISDPTDTVVCTSAGGTCVGPSPDDPTLQLLTVKAKKTGDWLLRTTPTNVGDYKLATALTPHRDCDLQGAGVDPGGDAGDTFAEASAVDFDVANGRIQFGFGCQGMLVHALDTQDWYQVTKVGQVNVLVYPDDLIAFLPDVDIDVCVYAPSDPVNPRACSRNPGPAVPEMLSFRSVGATEQTPWRVQVFFARWLPLPFFAPPTPLPNNYQLLVDTRSL